METVNRSTINVTLPSEHALPRGAVLMKPQLTPLSSPQDQTQEENLSPTLIKGREAIQVLAAHMIERCWCRYRDRQMFQLLKHAICAAEHSLTYEVLRKISPTEAHLLKDPSMNARIRFRFGGSEFPPMILFKIFTHTKGMGLQYYSGKKCIKPASEAAVDACQMMGNRKFYDQMIADSCQYEKHRITEEVDVTTVKDYMQYLSVLDELPAYMGGKENLWRKLDLNILTRSTILYDIVDYLEGNQASSRLQNEMKALISRPVTQELQREHIRIISELRTPEPLVLPKSQNTARVSSGSQSSRGSRQARQRASKMRRMYQTTNENEPGLQVDVTKSNDEKNGDDYHLVQSGDEFEEEADQLFTWTQNLSYEDIGLTS
ncbi:putative uncharacterized protein CXorf58 [Anneissia japonica]|uniref:putative uncharacterized protein CXorf58 n=1 Tax=Anneissia japonica TaxID=1529436 RepID=UPI00142580D3|nr:putative uncharacterized protein CXorf58 [Anneissia japonica]